MSKSDSSSLFFAQFLFSSSHLKSFLESEFATQAEVLALRHDIIVLLKFVEDNKVVGTKSTGNMPLKMIRELTANFSNPPVLDTKIGEKIYKLRSEEDVWQLYFLHILSVVGRLLKTGRGKRWRLTSTGKEFLQAPALIQLWFLLITWWHRVNWMVAYPFQGLGESLPPSFNYYTLESLVKAPVNKQIKYEPFADDLIKKSGLSWTSSNTEHHSMLLRASIERMVIDILTSFGMVEQENRERKLGKGKTFDLVSFKITQLGKILLESLVAAQVKLA